ncbi:MAG TPA: methyltransferase domain-containing protein [Candidatus Binataceae bacterium]|nr:methyltransferase domain-containing protein [Candidatus Binataceae bacterium]
MFTRTAAFYDAIYSFKDYQAEAEKLLALIADKRSAPARSLLDVACGTGLHLSYLRRHFDVEGLDLNDAMLDVARQRCPGVTFHHADMIAFDLGRKFDVVTCLFSAIGYATTVERLNQAVECMTRHLAPNGLLVIEPWLTPQDWRTGIIHALFVDRPELKIARLNHSRARGRLSVIDFHYLVGTPANIDYFTERHELGLFTREEYLESFRRAGLEVSHDAQGLMGRGLYFGLLRA